MLIGMQSTNELAIILFLTIRFVIQWFDYTFLVHLKLLLAYKKCNLDFSLFGQIKPDYIHAQILFINLV